MYAKRRRSRLQFLGLLVLSPMTKNSSQAFCFGSVTPANPTIQYVPTTIKSSNSMTWRHKQHASPTPDEYLSEYDTTAPSATTTIITKRTNLLWMRLRGGSDNFAENIKNQNMDFFMIGANATEEERRAEKWRRRGMSVALSSTYLSVMGAKCALPSVLSLLISSKTGLTFPPPSEGYTPQGLMARLLGLSTLVIASGKLLLGPVIDTLGGIRSLQLALASLGCLLVTISCTQRFTVFASCWIFVDFIFSSCWAGCLNAIHQSFPEKRWGRQIGILAAGARAGNALAFALFASILFSLEEKMKQPWRVIFGVSALIQVVPIALLTYFGGITLKKTAELGKEMPEQALEKSTIKSSLRVLTREIITPEFWLHLLSRSSLMVFASFLLFVPTLMSQVYGASNSFAAQVGSIYALGCLLSVTLGSSTFSRLPRGKQAIASFILMAAAASSSVAQLAHVSGVWKISAETSAALMFLWGFGFSIPFYIPPSLYALSRGGKQSSATIADSFDIVGFVLLAIFNGYVASIKHSTPAAWIPTFQITTACSLTSLISLTLAILIQ